MKWDFWIGTMSAVLNVLFIADFFAYALSGESLAALMFGDGSSSVSDLVLTYLPGMISWEFIAANGILLGFSVFLVLISIWIAYASSGVINDVSSCNCPKGGRR